MDPSGREQGQGPRKIRQWRRSSGRGGQWRTPRGSFEIQNKCCPTRRGKLIWKGRSAELAEAETRGPASVFVMPLR